MQIHDVEQNTVAWFAIRAGLPTASEFKKILSGTGKPSTSANSYAAMLAAELYAGGQLEQWQGNQWTERGHELEAEARAAYRLASGHEAEPVGFITNHGAGASPDGLVDSGLVEIKCLAPQNHVLALAYFNKHKRPQPDYIPQVQGQIWVAERDYVDLFFYHPILPELLIRVNRDQEYIDTLSAEVSKVIAERDRLRTILEAA